GSGSVTAAAGAAGAFSALFASALVVSALGACPVASAGGADAAGALALPRSAALSPSARMVAIGVLTATSAVPSGINILPSVPSSVASTSIVALSVSISAMTS